MKADFTKTVRVGMTPCGNRKENLFVKIKYVGGRLSISGVIGPRASGNAAGSAGQIDMGFEHREKDHRYENQTKASEIRYAPGWTSAMWLDLLDIWEEWHLNDVKAGDAEQEAYLRENPVVAAYPKSHYEEASKALTAAGLNPHNGYAYGSAWNHQAVPASVLDFLRNLPVTDKTPAWA